MKRLLKALYRRLPVVRELREIRDLLRRESAARREREAIRWDDFELERDTRYGDPKRLQRFAAQVCSQNGEDGMIREIFRRLGETDRVFVEVGVGDGTENNTAFLLAQGWTGHWIDGNPAFLDTVAARPELGGGALRTHCGFVTRENISGILDDLGVPGEFDFLSLDIDQNTWHVWRAMDRRRPRVVVVEYNASLPPDLDWVARYRADRVWDGSHNFGASLKAFERLGRELGYHLVGCDFVGANAFFVRDDLIGDHVFAEPFTAENHYEPPRYGTVHRRGHPRSLLDRPDPTEQG
ncbi:MAG: hypothetical protein H7A52_14645 [Akkermansiaceae bacterium]|nr:hypothetical protein [Akkermansiaceae bacterium]